MRTTTAMITPIFLCAIVLLGGGLNAQAPAAHDFADVAACEHLSSLAIPQSTVTAAQVIGAGKFSPPAGAKSGYADLPAFCRVELTLKPSSDSDIKSEVWLPMSGWNGKFQEVGNGGWNGDLQFGEMADALRRGYATSSTDTGHAGGSASFALGHPEKVIDFGYRAIHETAVVSKVVIAALYGGPQQISYFTGCSGGGRQAFDEAQRYPDDFEGIIAGDPGYDRTGESFQLVAAAQAMYRNPAGKLTPEKLSVLHQAALNACDALDEVKDGIITDPTRCNFDPAVTLCNGPDGPTCLTAAQVETAKKFYTALKDPKTDEEIFPGFEPGSELRWAALGEGPLLMAGDLFKYIVFQNPNWDYLTLDIGKDLALARKMDNGVISPTSANLKKFVDRGGKLIIYHGWGDQNVAPRSSVEYYEKLVKALGQNQVERSVRLYMVPAMGHCGGGEGPNVFDTVTALEKWREKKVPPQEIIASQYTKGAITRTRPLCPYPQVAQYKGSGNTDQAENFVCRVP